MLKPGDVCTVNRDAGKFLTGIYRSLIGKQVVIETEDAINDKYPIRVLHPDKEFPWEWSSQLQMKQIYLTKER